MYSVYTSLVLHYVFLQFQIRVSGANKELSFFDYGALHFFSEETSACAMSIIRKNEFRNLYKFQLHVLQINRFITIIPNETSK